jgi:amidophosphoribosyltransferase
MSDAPTHECGLAMVRLRQPLSHYVRKYGDAAWGLRRLYLLMEKQHNRGQDGAGVCVVKNDMPPGERFMVRARSDRNNAIERLFDETTNDLDRLQTAAAERDEQLMKSRCRFVGETYLGHLRYGTHSGNEKQNCHPLIRKNNTASRNLAIAGNFNMTNSAALFGQLVEYGLNPVGDSDTQVILERIGYFLDREHDQLYASMGPESFQGLDGRELADAISRELDLIRVLSKAAQGWDGGYVFGGLLGNGDLFVCRDPAGIRPCFVYMDDEVIGVASERAALAGVFDVDPKSIGALPPGHAMSVKRSGAVRTQPFTPPVEARQCTFERIYFSRGNDPDIYNERKELGRKLAPRVDAALDGDLDHAVFSFIPNTAETAYMGLVEELGRIQRSRTAEEVWERIESGSVRREDLDRIVDRRIRAEKIAHKDQRLRTFITHDAARRDLVLHIYDITRGIVGPNDTLVVLDDSIVRGTTLRESIIRILSRLRPRRIVVVSSAPPIMYPDCYGIDMSQLGRFIAFEAAVTMLEERGQGELIAEVEAACTAQRELPDEKMVNHVARLYDAFTLEEISARVAQLITPADLGWTGRIDVIYQRTQDMLAAMPQHTGDWYFTGNYPTPGGYRVLNTSFLRWRERSDARSY